MKETLFTAIEKGDLEIVKKLLGKGVDVNSADGDKETALYKACCTSNLPVVHALIQSGADVNLADCRGVTPLMMASLYGHLDIIQELLRNGADVKRVSDFGGALSHAVGANGSLKIVELLISAGANVNERSPIDENEPPLHCACRVGRADLVKVLLDAGADVNGINALDMTALWEVCANNSKTIPIELKTAYLEVVKLLISYGADVTLADEFSSILTTACDSDSENVVDMVKLILQEGNEQMLSYQDEDGLTALDIAKQHKNEKLVQELCQAETYNHK